jgi:hypothetical protein
LPANSLYIQGSGSDEDGKIKSYRWTKISGGNASLNGTSAARLRASNLREGTYTFRLTVEDNDGGTRSDDMSVVVKKANKGSNDKDKDDNSSSKNKLPLATAGPDRVITLPTNSVTIQGRATDKDGRIVSYEWAKTYGHNVSFAGANSSRVRIYNLTRGIYIFRLRVKDNDGGVRDDYFKVTVKEREKVANNNNSGRGKGKDNSSSRSSKANTAPYASAGPDRVVSLPNNAITIRANASDRDGKIASYLWEKTYGNRASLSGARTSQVRISNLRSGVYIFRLTVRDDDGAAAQDYFKVTVKESGVAVRSIDSDSGIASTNTRTTVTDVVGS